MVKLGLAQDESPYDALLKEILSDPDLIIEDAPRSALPSPALGWGKEWLPEDDDTIIGEVVPEPEPTPAPPAAPRGKRRPAAVKVPGYIRTGLRLDPSPERATFAP